MATVEREHVALARPDSVVTSMFAHLGQIVRIQMSFLASSDAGVCACTARPLPSRDSPSVHVLVRPV